MSDGPIQRALAGMNLLQKDYALTQIAVLLDTRRNSPAPHVTAAEAGQIIRAAVRL